MDRTYELMYVECSRVRCDHKKVEDDRVKLWRELNDGSYWLNDGCELKVEERSELGIIGVQVAQNTFHLRLLIRDEDNISRLYSLRQVGIPIQFTDDVKVVQSLVETLLLLRVCSHL
jgi:hypothetical protein